MSPDDPTEALIETLLEGAPRAQTWGQLREALEQRLAVAESAQERETLREQIAALAQEEAITRFVEDAVRVSVARPQGDEFDFDEGFGS